jgi:hypothetical protein
MSEKESKFQLRAKIPSVPELEGRFSFIDDQTLRSNIAISFQYVIFLIALIDELGLENTSISSSIHKDMIVHTGSIIESCIHHCLKKYIETGKVKSEDVMPTGWEMKNPKEVYKLSKDEGICFALRHKKTEYLTDTTQLLTIIRAAKRADILSEPLYKKADKMRILRNKIHLKGLEGVDGSYDKTDSQEAFDIAKAIIENIERKLT